MTRPCMIILLTLGLFNTPATYGQQPFSTIDSVDINNIKATVLVHGDMWWEPGKGIPGCIFPKDSGKDIAFAGSLWMSGFDANTQLHVAAQTYRQNGNDYWPGPLDSTGTISYNASQMWAKIWKVNRTEIDSFRALSSHSTTNTPAPILQWPAKGNPYSTGNGGVALTISTPMAPFIDVNNDGIYNALQGDYPDIKGDQALWWVFNDNGPTHTETNGQPFKMEVHAMAYAYKRGTIIDNVIYYEYDLLNRSANTYHNFRVGQWVDAELGIATDDYIGSDSTHRMGITYNANPIDGNGASNTYGFGDMIPTIGLTMLSLPGDAAPTSYVPAGSFMYYLNNSDPIYGAPAGDIEYDNLLRSRWDDGTHLTNNFAGPGHPATGYGGTQDCNYVFPGDPTDSGQWSECVSGNTPDDIRFVLASNDITFPAGSMQKVVTALLTTDRMLNNGCPSTNFSAIETLADTVWAVYQNPLPALAVNSMPIAEDVHIYPNPAHNEIHIDKEIAPGANIVVYNMLGQIVDVPASNLKNTTLLDIAKLPAGIYNLLYSKNGTYGTARFVKD